jgi:predicted transcriptional regulator of viral defense system
MAQTINRTSPSSLDRITPRALSIRSLDHPRGADVLSRVRGEFAEMRGFSPTIEQAARLFDLSRDECGQVLSKLEREGFLRRMPDGRYRLPA